MGTSEKTGTLSRLLPRFPVAGTPIVLVFF
jgi:hypothetical protein